MSNTPIPSISAHFASLPAPRGVASRTPHRLLDIIVITICAVTCGADSWVAVEAFGRAKCNWLATFLELPEGISSHDTFGRMFAAIDATKFEQCFTHWICSAIEMTQGQVIAVDGKQVRRSYGTRDNKAAIHLVSA